MGGKTDDGSDSKRRATKAAAAHTAEQATGGIEAIIAAVEEQRPG